MGDKKEILTEWEETYLKSRDVFEKKIVKIEKDHKPYDLFIEYKDKKTGAVALVPGEEDRLIQILKERPKEHGIFCALYNTKKSLDFIIKHWKELAEQTNLMICFVNPFTTPAEKWMLNPHIHNKICDHENLKRGFDSMLSAITEVNEKDIR